MTPKEKAQELVDKFKPFVQFKMGVPQDYVLKMAKQCALIAVDEILNIGCIEVPYWIEVKTEIENYEF